MPSPSDLLLHDAHAAAGARFGERRGQPVVASYGDTAGEYAAAREAAALVDLPLRAVLEASGPQRQKFLQGMLSHDVAGRQPGPGLPRGADEREGGGPGPPARPRREGRRPPRDGLRPDRLPAEDARAPPRRRPGPLRGSPDERSSPSSDRGPRACCSAAGVDSPPASPEAHAGRRDRRPPGAPRARGGPAGGRLRPARGAGERGGRVGGPARGGGAPRGARRPRRPAGRGAAALVRVGRDRGEPAPRDGPRRRVPLAQPRGATSARRWSRASRPAAATSTRPCAGCACRRRPRPARPSRVEGREVGRVTTAAVSPRLGPDRPGLRPPRPLRPGHRRRGRRRPGHRRDVLRGTTERDEATEPARE